MRFLVVTTQSTAAPPDMTPGLLEELSAWAKTQQEQGKLEQVWTFAELRGGGGIANVTSPEELDALMNGFPLGPFSSIQAYPLVDLEPSPEGIRQAIRAMMPSD
jgi:muconolactone delta-isomerase